MILNGAQFIKALCGRVFYFVKNDEGTPQYQQVVYDDACICVEVSIANKAIFIGKQQCVNSVQDGIILREDNNGTDMCKKIHDILEVWVKTMGITIIGMFLG